jgi:hypothetical protein
MTKTTITRYVVEISSRTRTAERNQICIEWEVIDALEVYASSLDDALAQAYTECDNAYVEVYGPSVADWMRVRLVNQDTGRRTKWLTLDALGDVPRLLNLGRRA